MIIIARMNPAMAPITDIIPASGMKMAVPIAVVAIRMRRIPVFSVVPSMVIKLDS